MNPFRRWAEKLFGLRSEVENEIEKTVRLNTTLAGAVARAQVVQEAEEYAAELGRTNPALADALRAAIAAQTILSPLNAPVLSAVAEAGSPPADLRETPPKKLFGRKKPHELPAATAPNSDE